MFPNSCLILYAQTLHSLKRLHARRRTSMAIKDKKQILCDPEDEKTIEDRIVTCFDKLESYN